jgi:tryptophan synthase alpha chain
MTSRLEPALASLRARREGALVAYLTAGYPTLVASEELALAACAGGADLLELGVPFSDPVADGPTIQRSSHTALGNGATLEWCLKLVARLRARGVTVPIALMGYCNPFLRRGLEATVLAAHRAGVDALVIPDLPAEESGPFRTAMRAHGMDLISFVAPTTSEERLPRTAAQAEGFVYCVAVNGVTGVRRDTARELPQLLERVRRHTRVPLLAGFGISTPEQVANVCRIADGAIVGSALVECIDRGGPFAPERLQELVAALKAATKERS